FNEDGVPFYLTLLFFPKPTSAWLTLNSLLSLVGCIWAVRSKNMRLKYCALFLVVSLVVLVFTFTMRADRYFYPLLPVHYLISAYTLLNILLGSWRFARSHIAFSRRPSEMSAPVTRLVSRPLHWAAVLIGILACACVIVGPMLPISNY